MSALRMVHRSRGTICLNCMASPGAFRRTTALRPMNVWLPPMGLFSAMGTGKCEGTGTWTSAVLEADGAPDKRAMGTGLCVRSRVRQSISNLMDDILGRSMSPLSSSTLMHQLLRPRDRFQRKLIVSILY